jgi:hypothetical protein
MRSTYGKASIAFVAALALCALVATSASAAQFYVNGKALTGSEKLSTTVKTEESAVISFYANNKEPPYLQVTCPTVSGMYLESITSTGAITTGRAGLGFLECKVTKPIEEDCEVESSSLFTLPLEGKMSLGSKSPEDNAEFASLNGAKKWLDVNLDERGCAKLVGIAAGNEWEVRGKLTVKVPTGQKESAEQQVVFEGTEGLYSFNTLQPVHITTKIKLKLASGLPWSFH